MIEPMESPSFGGSSPFAQDGLAEDVSTVSRESRPLRIVTIGGGTGLPVMLRGLRDYASSGRAGADRIDIDHVSAIVSVSDDGGSSGRLMQDFDVLPPGDIRNCLLALADESQLPLLRKFLEYRFSGAEDGELLGHSIGNILITALTRINGDDFRKAILDVSRILNLRGKILLPTLEKTVLCAGLSDGTEVRGESRIGLRWSSAQIRRIWLQPLGTAGRFEGAPATSAALQASSEAVEAIHHADLVILGPGSLYTSTIPPILVGDVQRALIERSHAVPVVYVCNIMTEAGETDGYSVGDHVRALLEHAPGLRLWWCIANSQRIAEPYLHQYATERMLRGYATVRQALDEVIQRNEKLAYPYVQLMRHAEEHASRLKMLSDEMRHVLTEQVQVLVDPERDAGLGCEVVAVNAVQEVEIVDGGGTKKVIRHNAVAVLDAILRLMEVGETAPTSTA